MKRLYISILLIISLISVIFSNIAQLSDISIKFDEFISYIRLVDGQQEYVARYADKTIIYPMPENTCFSLSPDWRYIVVFTRHSNSLQIFHLPSNKLVAQNSWDGIQFDYCGVIWSNNNQIITLLKTFNPIVDYQFSFDSLGITRLEDLIPRNLREILPNYVLTTEDSYIWASPNPDIVLYEACYTNELIQITDDKSICSDFTKLIIYNIDQNQIIEELPSDLDRRFLRGDRVGRSSISEILVAWSYDSRYLIFCDCEDVDQPVWDIWTKINIYDLQTDTYLDAIPNTALANINRKYDWSDNAYLLAIWSSAIPDYAAYPDYYPQGDLNQLIIADIETGTTVISQGIFDVRQQNLVWAPDSRAVAFLAKERIDPLQIYEFSSQPYPLDLILISTTTGEHTVIDTDVTEIITWRSICDFTVSDTASLISTMQAEPYSVICLDENGQYDLTAPLPDVAGDITIIGNGSTITMTGQNRILNVVYNQQWSRNGSLTLKNVTLSGGVADDGGAIFNAGDLTLDNVTLQNHSAVRGGAIYNIGNLVMNGGAIQNNSASEFGGGIYNIGDMQLDGVNIRDNTAPEGSGVYQG